MAASPEPYADFESAYETQSRNAAYKVLIRSDACDFLNSPTQVRLVEAVSAFDYGWGRGQVWRVAPVSRNSDVPETLFIRIRETDWATGSD